ncbi:MAG: DUF4838 domain-containing protein [Armatimonadetes bacterium]|nr:DUF4838 domain-containing protein [Armatimonadota bacterium]
MRLPTSIVGVCAFGALMAVGQVCRAADGMVIVRDGQPAATVVTAADAGPKVSAAVAELREYVRKMSGAELPVATDAAPPEGRLILVGPSRLTRDLEVPSGLTNPRREEGYVVLCRGERLVLAGNDEGPYHGTEYAVYDLLRRLGVRWFMPGEYGEIVPRQSTIVVPELEVREKPDFIMRNWWLHAKPELAGDEKQWKLRNRMSPDNMFATPGDSSARNVLPEAQYFKDHPEYFALNPDGSRNPYLPNLANPEAVKVAAGIIKAYLREHPDANSYGFAPDDGLPRDYDPETLRLHQGFVDLLGRPGVAAEESTTEEWLSFVNRVAAEVRREFPDAYIATNGYANRNLPPQGVKLDDHLVIMFAAIWSCTLHAYDDPHCWQKVRQGQMLQQWCKLCPNVWIYGYNYQMLVSGLTPLPETRKLARDFPLLHKWGVIGFLDETRNVWAECGISSRYLRAQLEWDAEADVEAILQDFYTKWYGAAAEPMRAFYDAIEDAIETSPLHGHEDRVMPYIYSPKLLHTLEPLLEQAERWVDSDRARQHVHADRLIFEHLRAYMATQDAEQQSQFAEAARHAERMMALRKELHAINPFYIWYDEERYHSGIWYWGVEDRKKWYLDLADRMSGKTGDLIARLPEDALFRTDPYDAGIADEWCAGEVREASWRPIATTKPLYLQGHEDAEGHPYVGSVWYRLRVDVPDSAAGRKIMLYVPTVETEAWCWVNGQYVGHRPYREAYVRPAEAEFGVSQAVRPGQTNLIAIRVSTGLSLAAAAGGLQARLFMYAPKE